MKNALIAIAALLSVGLIIYLNLTDSGGRGPVGLTGIQSSSVQVAPADRHSLSSYISAPGRIAAAQRVEVYSNVQGQIEKIDVVPGDVVKSGHPLVTLGSKRLDTELRRAKLAQERAVSDLQEAATNVESAKASFESKKRQMDLYSDAKDAWDQAVINERLAQAKVDQTKRVWEQWKGRGGGAMSKQDEWQAKNAYDNAVLELELAANRSQAAQAKMASVQLASQDEVESLKAKYEATVSRQASLAKSVKEAEESIALSQQEVDKLTISTPIDGTITRVNVVVGEFVTPGAMNSPGTVLVTVANLNTLLVEADVDETDVIGVQVGQKADIACDALADAHFTGRVIEVAGSGQKESGSEISIFLTKIRIDDPGEAGKALRPGLSAHVEIEIASRTDCLCVPLQAVVERLSDVLAAGKKGSKSVVFVVEDDRAVMKAVKTGLSDDTHVEILSGLKKGDSVIIGPYRLLERLSDGDPIRVAEPTKD